MAGTGRHLDDLPEDDHCFETSPGVATVRSFENLGLKSEVVRGIYRYGFEKPSAIQQRAVQPIVSGRDVIVQAQSNTGKTAMIAFSMLQHVDSCLHECQVLILSPTRALATQTAQTISAIGKDLKILPHCCIGGSNLGEDIRRCKQGAHVVSGTPGRVLDMIRRRALGTRGIRAIVLDEADDMLAQGFREQIYDIYRRLVPDTQVVVVATTMPYDLLDMTRKFMADPIRILVKREESLEGVKQFFVAVEREEWKLDTLMDLRDTFSISQAIVFVNSKRKADLLRDRLRGSFNLTVASLHGDTHPLERKDILADFRAGGCTILIATDSLSQGLDIPAATMVINFDLPFTRELYLRRLRRAGGHGRKGVALNFVREDDVRVLRDIKAYYATQVDEMPPNVADLMIM